MIAAAFGVIASLGMLAITIVTAICDDSVPLPFRVALPLGWVIMLLTPITGKPVFLYIGGPMFIIGGCTSMLYDGVLAGRPRWGARKRRNGR